MEQTGRDLYPAGGRAGAAKPAGPVVSSVAAGGTGARRLALRAFRVGRVDQVLREVGIGTSRAAASPGTGLVFLPTLWGSCRLISAFSDWPWKPQWPIRWRGLQAVLPDASHVGAANHTVLLA
jgi:hypothetical protein